MLCYCAATRRAARLLTMRYDAHLRPSGLTSAQFEMMSVIATNRALHGRALADLLALGPATVSRNLRPLIESGDVDASIGEEDARLTLYSLTPDGAARLKAATSLWQRAHRETEALFGDHGVDVQIALQFMGDALRG